VADHFPATAAGHILPFAIPQEAVGGLLHTEALENNGLSGA